MKIKSCLLQAITISLLTPCIAQAAIEFNTNDPGIAKGMNYWGIGWVGNTQRNINRIGGEQNIDFVRIGCPKEWPLENGQLSTEARAEVDKQMGSVTKVKAGNPNLTWSMVCSGGNGINDWYLQKNGTDIRGARWRDMFKAVRNYVSAEYGMNLAYIEVGNEQDFNRKKGSATNLNSIQQRFRTDPELSGIPLVGPSTLSSGPAQKWYGPMAGSLDWGATHAINGSGRAYIDFVKQVRADGKQYFGSEVHNLVEMIIAEEYGGLGGLWWNNMKEEDGLFVQYSQQGNRLFYREKADSFSATSAYKGDNNTIHIFAASIEGTSFEYRSRNRAVYFDGKGPQRSFTITLGKNEVRHIEVTMDGPSNPPANPPTGGASSRTLEAESGSTSGSASIYTDSTASNGRGVAYISQPGAGVSFTNVPASNEVTIRYASALSGKISIRVNGNDVGDINFSSTGNWVGNYNSSSISLNIPRNATVELFFDNGDTALNLDNIEFKRR